MSHPQGYGQIESPAPAGLTSKSMIEIGQVVTLIGVAFYVGQKFERMDGALRELAQAITRTSEESATKAEVRELRLELRSRGIEVRD